MIHQVQPALGQPLFVYINSMVILGKEPVIRLDNLRGQQPLEQALDIGADGTGRYLILSLPVGQYEVRVTKAGFQDAIRSGIHLDERFSVGDWMK